MKKLILIIAVILLSIAIIIGIVNIEKDETTISTADATNETIEDTQQNVSMYDESISEPFAVNNNSKLVVGQDIQAGTYNLTISENTYLIVKTGEDNPISYDSNTTSLSLSDNQKITISGNGSVVFDYVQ